MKRQTLSAGLLFVLLVLANDAWAQPAKQADLADKTDQKEQEAVPGAMDVHFRDGSILKVKIKDREIAFETPHGKLSIPVGDIRKVDVGVHLTAEESKRIDSAISDLGHADAKRRAAAEKELLSLKERGYAALVRQSKSENKATAGQAAAVLDKLRTSVPAEKLEQAQVDVVYTTMNSKIIGRLRGESLRVATLAFGEVDVKFADIRSIQSLQVEKKAAAAVPLSPAAFLQQKIMAACPEARSVRVFEFRGGLMVPRNNADFEIRISPHYRFSIQCRMTAA